MCLVYRRTTVIKTVKNIVTLHYKTFVQRLNSSIDLKKLTLTFKGVEIL
jgi:hypothetical protein